MKEGSKAIDFSLKDQNGKTHKLSDYKGKPIVLYFYPKDDTPGCTMEACSFRDNYKDFKKKGAIVIGVSVDSEESHKKFAEKYKLPFILLADPEKKVVKKYGVWGEKSFMGKKYMGTTRATFIIDENFKIKKIFPKVSVVGHTKEVLKYI
ncbi:MAG: peroxiredoxin [Candidatus Woesearchaeota archaeon]|nr:MAG: peroxiredoxin [Candidatus Woesearchaeota archaeon]